jgi:predicted O-methyltransferase YrrM
MINEFVEPGHFYSVIPHIDKDTYIQEIVPKYNLLNFNHDNHEKILRELPDVLKDFDVNFSLNLNKHKVNNRELQIQIDFLRKNGDINYYLGNGAFEWMDARLLYYFILTNKPKNIIEIGSGNSTLLMCKLNKLYNLNINITCIEPYPTDYLIRMHNEGYLTLIKEKLENVNLSIYETLNENDILFIDSSHVVKINSDVMFYFTQIFPVLKKNVLIHIHDIFFPYEYPENWIKEGRFWNEQYFLYTFLQYNSKFTIQYSNSYANYKYSDKLVEIQHDSYENLNYIDRNNASHPYSGGSIWIKVEY